MPRRHRVFIEGTSHHVIQRGNNRIDIFRSPSDYKVFLSFVRKASLRYRIDVHAYVLMTNHVHLMVTPATATALPRAMQAVGRRYVPYFNERYKRTGSLFEGRYRSLVIDEESYWVTCMRYVELNPVRAGLVDRPKRTGGRATVPTRRGLPMRCSLITTCTRDSATQLASDVGAGEQSVRNASPRPS
jgi:putative transposase